MNSFVSHFVAVQSFSSMVCILTDWAISQLRQLTGNLQFLCDPKDLAHILALGNVETGNLLNTQNNWEQ